MNGLKLTTRRFAAAISLCVAATLTGCFTGVDSTPKISDREVRRQTPVETPDDSFLQPTVDSLNSLPLRSGLPLLVDDGKIRLILEPAAISNDIAAGDTLRFVSVEPSTTVDGRRVAEVRMTDRTGRTLSYRTNLRLDQITRLGDLNIPFLIPLEPVEAIRSKLLDRRFYLTTSSRYDLTDNLYTGRRFVPVTITAVDPGNAYYPIRLSLCDDLGTVFRLYLSVDAASPMPRKFSSQLSTSDPRKKYSSITDATWSRIIEGRVAQGMTRDECRLALGVPDNVDRQASYSSVRELWTYRNGRYLIFIDGVLESFRL